MFALRRLILAHRHLAALVCVAALALKLLVPAGYMISSDHGRFAITICSGSVPVAMPAMHGDMLGHDKAPEPGKSEMPCAFSSLSAHALAGVDPVLLLAAIAFVMAVGLRPGRAPALPLLAYLRPPLRGPPATL